MASKLSPETTLRKKTARQIIDDFERSRFLFGSSLEEAQKHHPVSVYPGTRFEYPHYDVTTEDNQGKWTVRFARVPQASKGNDLQHHALRFTWVGEFPQPAAAPASQPQTVTPADEAALGVSMSELNAALDAVPQDTIDTMLAFIADRPRSADVFQPSGLAILDGLVAEGKATLTNGYYEATKASPADCQLATSEPAADVLDGVEKIIDFGDWCELYYRDHVVTVDGFENEPKFNAILSALEGQRWAKYHEVDTDIYFPRPQSPVASQPAESEMADQRSDNANNACWFVMDHPGIRLQDLAKKFTLQAIRTARERGVECVGDHDLTCYYRDQSDKPLFEQLVEKDAEIRRLQADLADARELAKPAESETIDQRLHQMYLDDRDEGYANSHPQTYTHWLEETINRMDKSIRYLHSKLDELEPISANMAIASNILQDNANLREQLDAANRKLAAIRQADSDAIEKLVCGDVATPSIFFRHDDEQAAYQERSGRPDSDDDLLTADDVRGLLFDGEPRHIGD